MQISSLINWRKWRIVTELLRLNVTHYRFNVSLVGELGTLREFSRVRIAVSELPFAEHWNARISRVLNLLGADYTVCLKRCFVLALLLDKRVSFDYVIGINPDDHNDGHAWLEINRKIVTEYPVDTRYVVIKKLPITPT